MKTYINTYATIDTVLESLMGKSKLCGKSLVDAFCGRWDTRFKLAINKTKTIAATKHSFLEYLWKLF